jgi:hypothetical protein
LHLHATAEPVVGLLFLAPFIVGFDETVVVGIVIVVRAGR